MTAGRPCIGGPHSRDVTVSIDGNILVLLNEGYCEFLKVAHCHIEVVLGQLHVLGLLEPRQRQGLLA